MGNIRRTDVPQRVSQPINVSKILLIEAVSNHDHVALLRSQLKLEPGTPFEVFSVASFAHYLDNELYWDALVEKIRACIVPGQSKKLIVVGGPRYTEVNQRMFTALAGEGVKVTAALVDSAVVPSRAPTVMISCTDFRLWRENNVLDRIGSLPGVETPFMLLTYHGGLRTVLDGSVWSRICAEELRAMFNTYSSRRLMLCPHTDCVGHSGSGAFENERLEHEALESDIDDFLEYARTIEITPRMRVQGRPVMCTPSGVEKIMVGYPRNS